MHFVSPPTFVLKNFCWCLWTWKSLLLLKLLDPKRYMKAGTGFPRIELWSRRSLNKTKTWNVQKDQFSFLTALHTWLLLLKLCVFVCVFTVYSSCAPTKPELVEIPLQMLGSTWSIRRHAHTVSVQLLCLPAPSFSLSVQRDKQQTHFMQMVFLSHL